MSTRSTLRKQIFRIFFALALVISAGAAWAANADAAQTIEDAGYTSPEDAVKAYLDGLRNADLEKMVGTFAVESYVDNFNLRAQIERLHTYMETVPIKLPNTNEFFRKINIENHKNRIILEIYNQYITWSQPNLSEKRYTPIRLEGAAEISMLLNKLEDAGNEAKLKSLKTLKIREFISPGKVNDRYDSEANQKNLTAQKIVLGADEYQSVVALVEVEQQFYLFCFDAALYGRKWRISSLSGNIGNILGIDPYSGGLDLQQ
jgi:hypothetical protein